MMKSDDRKISIKEYLDAIPYIPLSVKWMRGHIITGPCPCGGTIKAVRSKYNGHLHAKCEKCGFCLMV